MFRISYGVFPQQTFPAKSNVCGYCQEPTNGASPASLAAIWLVKKYLPRTNILAFLASLMFSSKAATYQSEAPFMYLTLW